MSTSTTPEQNKQLVVEMLEVVWNQRDTSNLDRYYSPDFVNHTVPAGAPTTIDSLKRLIPMLTSAFPDHVYIVDELVSEDDRVVARCRHEGTHKGLFLGHEPTDNIFSMLAVHTYWFKDGKISEHWGVHDDMGMRAQLGLFSGPRHPAELPKE
jgi:predicted ester cyclase